MILWQNLRLICASFSLVLRLIIPSWQSRLRFICDSVINDLRFICASFSNRLRLTTTTCIVHLRSICARFSMVLRSILPSDCQNCVRFSPDFVVLSARSVVPVTHFETGHFRISRHESRHESRHCVGIAEPKQVFYP
jgi:hypothetical protein